MSKPLLSILIPTVVGRSESFWNLVEKLKKRANIQDSRMRSNDYWAWNGVVEIFAIVDNKEMTIGEKREKLYTEANGVYSFMIDDDDDIADGAIEKILEAIKQEPDCITFKEKCIIDGKYYASNFSLKYDKWQDNFDGYAWVRTPFYKCVIKTEIAQQVPFEHIRYNEDERWANALKPFLKTEVHIDEEIYYYIHNSTPHHERYGFDKD